MSVEPTTSVVLLIDDKKLRLAELSAFLSSWAEMNDLEIVSLDPADVSLLAEHSDCRLCVVSIGPSLDDAKMAPLLKLLVRLFPDAPTVVVADCEIQDEVVRAFDLGAVGFIPTSMPPDVAVAALTFILEGGAYIPPFVLGAAGGPVEHVAADPPPHLVSMRDRLPKAQDKNDPTNGVDDQKEQNGSAEARLTQKLPTPRLDEAERDSCARPLPLTGRQGDVLACLRLGKSNKEIARSLEMSEATVKVHVRQVMKKLGVNNRTQAALVAASIDKRTTIRPSPFRQ